MHEPFAVVESYEIQGTLYTLIRGERQIKSYRLKGNDVNIFLDNRNKMRHILSTAYGNIYEFNRYRSKLYPMQKYKFIREIIK